MAKKEVFNACYVWEIRANDDNYEDIDAFRAAWKGLVKSWVVQREEGKEGYKHWQGRVSLIKKARKNEIMGLIKGKGEPVPNYLEPTVTKEHKKEAFYQLKDDSRIEGPWTSEDKVKYIPRQFRNINFYPWQQEVYDSYKQFEDRRVDCIIDRGGCQGKSTIARLAMLNAQAIELPCHNDGIKLIQAACCQLMGRELRQPTHIFCDLPRSSCQDKLHGLYTAIEVIKIGPVYDERNHYKEWWYDSPRVWVFTNTPPDMKYLSMDRWKLWQISDSKELEPYVPSKEL